MKEIVTQHKDIVAAWVATKVGMTGSWGDYYALGILDTEKRALVAGVVFNNWNGANATVHIAMEPGVGRAMVKLFEAVCDYAFTQNGLKRLTGLVPASKPDVLKFDKHLGFEEEFLMKDGAPDGDMHVLVLWPHKCRWLSGEKNGSPDKQA